MMAFLHLPYYLVWSPRVLMICKRTHLVGYYGPEAVSDNFIMNRLYARLFYSTNSNVRDRLIFLAFVGFLVFLFAYPKIIIVNTHLPQVRNKLFFYIKIYIDHVDPTGVPVWPEISPDRLFMTMFTPFYL